MVAAGVTEPLPSAGRLGPPSIDTLSALLVNQIKTAESPAVIVPGAAEKPSTVGAGGGGAGLPPDTGPSPEMPSQVPPWLDFMLIVPELCGPTGESLSRYSQFPILSTAAVPSTGEPDIVGPAYNVITLPGPGIELVPDILHSPLSARYSNLVIVRISLGAESTVTSILEVAVPPGPVAVRV